MGILTTEEKLYINPKTGNSEWVTTKKGLIKPRRTKGSLDIAIKEHQRKERILKRQVSKKKWEKRKKTAVHIYKGVNKALDWVEGKPPKKQKQRTKPCKKHYIIRNGIAYPTYQQKKKKTSKKQSKRKGTGNVPFDMKIHW